MLDLGTGTGRLLELFAPLYARAVGVDMSRDMLAVARANLDRAGLTRVQVRQADIFLLPTPAGHFDFVSLHQVLHYLDDPAAAIREAARALAPGGRLLIADFAPHELEFLREEHNHLRLGFSHEQLREWLEAAGLEVDRMVDLKPDPASGDQKLTVTLCLARDPRMLVADSDQLRSDQLPGNQA
jgi:ArsR family transcriptional regulator